MTHTAGPWQVYMGDYDGQRAAVIAHTEDMLVVARCPPFEAANETVEANARLIAAAPDLLEALKPFADIDGEGSEDFPDDTPVTVMFGRTTHHALKLADLRKARAIIARATEEEPKG